MQHPFIDQLTTQFIAHADPALKPRQEAYMRNQFPFFGINQTKRLAIQKELFHIHPIQSLHELEAITKTLWALQTREYRYTAMDLLRKHKKLWTRDTLDLFKACILSEPWWDSIDTIAAHCLGPLCIEFPELVQAMDQWIESDTMWLRRSAILFQLRYKKATNAERLFFYCTKTMHEKEFFIRKAIGWALREYSKTDPNAVVVFVTQHAQLLSNLSKREALKRIPEAL